MAGGPLRILLVEDTEALQLLVQAYLDGTGHSLEIVADGPSALARVAREGIDLVLLDLHLPGLDGIETLRRLRAQERASGARACPVVAVTADALVETRQRCTAAGFDDFLTKPLRRPSLLASIGRWAPSASTQASDAGDPELEAIVAGYLEGCGRDLARARAALDAAELGPPRRARPPAQGQRLELQSPRADPRGRAARAGGSRRQSPARRGGPRRARRRGRGRAGPARAAGHKGGAVSAEVLRILVVDDEPVNRIAVRRYLASVGGAAFAVDEASDGAAALAAPRAPADCVLLDLYLPDTTGLDWMRAFPEGRERPPVVLLTGLANHQTALEALQGGAEDYLVKDELTAGVLARTIRHAVERGRTRRALEESRRKIEEVAFLDPLTGMLNRRGLEHMLRGNLARAERAGAPLSAILLDCDDFKGVNTLHGHAGGDEVLREVAARLRGAVRPSDRVARVGGDEFLVIAPDTSRTETMALAERLRVAVSEEPIALPLGRVIQRATMGVFAVPARAATVTDLLAVGSAVVLESKAAGKDRIAAERHAPGRGDEREAASTRAPVCQPIVRLDDGAVVGHELALDARTRRTWPATKARRWIWRPWPAAGGWPPATAAPYTSPCGGARSSGGRSRRSWPSSRRPAGGRSASGSRSTSCSARPAESWPRGRRWGPRGCAGRSPAPRRPRGRSSSCSRWPRRW